MKNKEKNFASAVIYVHNAQSRVEVFLRKIIEILEENFEHSEIICVNDFSGDDSLSVIKETSKEAETANITVLNMSYFHGVELAMNAGVDLSIGDFVFEFDNTFLDFDSAIVMDVYKRALQGYDMVSATPDRAEKISSKLFYKVFDCFTDASYRMNTESFRVLSRRLIHRIGDINKTIPYRKVVYSNSGLKVDNIKYKPIRKGKKLTDKKEKNYRVDLAMDSLILFTEVGYKFSVAMTLLMMLVSIFMFGYSVIIYLTAQPVAGWTTTILFLAVAFFGLFGVLTIIVKYLQILLNLVFKRKQYSFESIEKLTK